MGRDIITTKYSSNEAKLLDDDRTPSQDAGIIDKVQDTLADATATVGELTGLKAKSPINAAQDDFTAGQQAAARDEPLDAKEPWKATMPLSDKIEGNSDPERVGLEKHDELDADGKPRNALSRAAHATADAMVKAAEAIKEAALTVAEKVGIIEDRDKDAEAIKADAKQTAREAKDATNEKATELKDRAEEKKDEAANATTDIADTITDQAVKAKDAIADTAIAAKDAVGDAFNAMGETLADAKDNAAAKAKDVTQTCKEETRPSYLAVLTGTVTDVTDKAAEAFGTDDRTDAQKAMANIGETAGNIGEGVGGAAVEVKNAIAEKAVAAKDAVAEKAVEAKDAVVGPSNTA